MNHLTDETLNEYLDAELPLTAQAEAARHLAACPSCRARLDALLSLFSALDGLPDAGLAHDLSPAVLAALGKRAAMPRAVRVLVIGQALAALVILALAWPVLRLDLASFGLSALPGLFLPAAGDLPGWAALQWAAWSRPFAQLGSLTRFSPSFSLNLDPPAVLITLTIVSACLLWLVGNGLLLRPRAGSYKRRHS